MQMDITENLKNCVNGRSMVHVPTVDLFYYRCWHPIFLTRGNDGNQALDRCVSLKDLKVDNRAMVASGYAGFLVKEIFNPIKKLPVRLKVGGRTCLDMMNKC
jgi:hypothetical protein